MEVASTKGITKPSLPLKIRIIFKFLSAVISATRRRDGTVNRRLFNLLDIKVPPKPNPVDGVRTYDVTFDRSHNLWFRVFTAVNLTSGNLPVIVYFHGGGFVHFNANSRPYDVLCRQFARETGAVVVSVDYRLAPEHNCPVQYEDGLDALKFLDAYGEKWLPESSDLSSCFIAGDSAGGNLAHHVAVRACKSEFQQLKVVGLVALQPFFGGEERTESEKKDLGVLPVSRTDWYWDSFLPEGSNRDHEAVNVSGPNAIDISSLEYFPTTIVFIGGFDVLQDWQRRYCDWLNINGKKVYKVEYPQVIHGFYAFSKFKEFDQLLLELRDFIQNQKKRESTMSNN